MDLVWEILVVIAYILLIIWIFVKKRNDFLAKKSGLKDVYKNVYRNIEERKLPKYLLIISKILIVIVFVYMLVEVLLLAILISFPIYLLGTGYEIDFFKEHLVFIGKYNYFLYCIKFFFFLIIYMLLIRAIHINRQVYKLLINKQRESYTKNNQFWFYAFIKGEGENNMTEQKRKAYEYLIFISIIGVVVSGINFLAFKLPTVGVACIITMISTIITIACYNIEKQSKRES